MQYSCLSLMLFLVLFCNTAIAQISISGIINDEKTGEALPFVTVKLVSENRYSRANENGAFKIYPLKRIVQDTLVFSSIGYLPVKIVIGQVPGNLKVKMKQDVTQLREVRISRKEMILGRYTRTGNQQLYKPYKGTSMITRRFMTDPGYNYLKKVMIWRKPDRISGKGKAKFRITIYNSENNTGPPNDVVYEQILVDDEKKEELVVDLLKYRILLPTAYFFVGIERIPNDKKTNLEPWVYSTDDRQYSWIKSFGENNWRNVYIKPAIAAIVM